MNGASGLCALLRGDAMVIAPGAYDGLTAKLVAQAGFSAVYMTGAGTSVSQGYPDFGLLTMSEMVDNAWRIVRSVANAALSAGADMAFVEAPQTMDELAAVPKRVAGPCLLNVVRGGKTPEIDLRRAQEMGYHLAIVPGLLLKAVIGACDEMLTQLKVTHVHPVPRSDMTVREAFNRVGADEWDTLRTRFRDAEQRRAAE